MPHNRRYAHDHEPLEFVAAVNMIEPHVLIGATGAPGTFSKQVVEAISSLNDRPAILALSNPTSRAECTVEQAYKWSDGKAIITSSSPFDPVEHGGKMLKPGQGNNDYIYSRALGPVRWDAGSRLSVMRCFWC